jgi:aspartate kinase
MGIIVLKFGGASLKDLSHLERAADIILQKKMEFSKVIVIVSAMGKTTDDLLQLVKSVSKTPPLREQDMLISVGERISMSLLAIALSKRGVLARSFTGSQAGIITTEEHCNAKIVDVRPKRLIPYLDRGDILIIAGFQGVSLSGEITTLGRGGSDTSAVALAVSLKAEKVEFYKDVKGIFSSDPKNNLDATLYTILDYKEVLELIKDERVKVLHPRAIKLAEKNYIPLHVLTFHIDERSLGTLVLKGGNQLRIDPVYEKFEDVVKC